MLVRFLGTLAVIAAFAVTFYLLARRRPSRGCDGQCAGCCDFARCPEDAKFIPGPPSDAAHHPPHGTPPPAP